MCYCIQGHVWHRTRETSEHLNTVLIDRAGGTRLIFYNSSQVTRAATFSLILGAELNAITPCEPFFF